jgi:two-component system KDP operon response regulator KdpE
MSETALHVLIIEDEAEIRRFVRMALQAEGLVVYEADSLQRGLIEAGTRRPDLIVLESSLGAYAWNRHAVSASVHGGAAQEDRG